MKKILKIILVIGIFLVLSKNTYAKSSEIVLGEQIPNITLHIKTTNKDFKKGMYKLLNNETKELVYCIEPGVLLKNGDFTIYDKPSEVTDIDLTDEEWEYIKLITYYGYGYSNQTTIDWYVATQFLIWQYILRDEGTINFTDYNNTDYNNYMNCVKNINNNIAKHAIIPSFTSVNLVDDQNITLRADHETKFIDKTNTIKNYIIDNSNEDVALRIVNNELYITAKKTGYKTLKFYLAKGEAGHIFYHAGSQTVVSRNNYFDPVYCKAKVTIPTVTVTKTTDIPTHLSLAGAVFNIYESNGKFYKRYTTDESGKITLYDFPFGQYYIEEMTAPYGMEKREGRIGFIMEVKDASITIKNKVILKNVSIEKYTLDGNDNLDIEDNAIFEIHLIDDDSLIDTIKLDEYGKRNIKLQYGKYYLKQISVKDGYVPISRFEFEINDKSPDITRLILKDPIIKGNLTIFKENRLTSSLILSKVRFKIKNLDTNTYLNINGNEDFITNNGIITLTNIPYGNYEIEEIESPIGYLKGENKKFSIKNNNEEIKIIFYNDEIKGNFELTKLDSITNKPLTGVSFKIKNLDTNAYLIYENKDIFITNEGKFTILDIPYGNYEIEEIEALPNYLKGEKAYFQINEQGKTVKLTIYNTKETGSLNLLKLDSLTNEPLSLVKFALYNQDGSLYQEFLTDEEGTAKIENIPVGDYNLKEISTLDGYELALDEIPLTIKKGICSNITLVNRQKIEDVPNTSTKEFLIALLISSAMLGAGSLISYICKRKNEKNRN